MSIAHLTERISKLEEQLLERDFQILEEAQKKIEESAGEGLLSMCTQQIQIMRP